MPTGRHPCLRVTINYKLLKNLASFTQNIFYIHFLQQYSIFQVLYNAKSNVSWMPICIISFSRPLIQVTIKNIHKGVVPMF